MGILDGLFSSGSDTNKQTSTTRLPAWLTNFQRDYANRMGNQLELAGNIYTGQQNVQPYDGQRLQAFTPDQMVAMQMARDSVGVADPYLNTSMNLLQQGAQGYQGPTFDPGQLGKVEAGQYGGPNYTGGDQGKISAGAFQGKTVQDYMDPYKQAVIDPTMARLERQRQIAGLGNDAAATKAGAFGGSQNALRQAETDRGYLDTVASTLANLNDQSYGRAADIYAGDQGRGLQASGLNLQGVNQQQQMFNQGDSRALQAAGLNISGLGQQQQLYNQDQSRGLQAAGLAGNLAPVAQAARQGDISSLLGMGTAQQAQGQQALDIQYQDYLTQKNKPFENFNFLQAATQGAQYNPNTNSTTTGTTQTATPSPFQSILGAGLATAGVASMFSKGGPAKRKYRPGSPLAMARG